MTTEQKNCTHIVHSTNSPIGIESYSYDYGDDYVYVRAVVEDMVLIHRATQYSPSEYGPALCESRFLWDNPIEPSNAPTQKEVENLVRYSNSEDWIIIEE